MSSGSRRRSSQHHRRISLLPKETEDDCTKSEVFQLSKSDLQRTVECIGSTILTVNSEFNQSDGISPFGGDVSSIADQVLVNIGCSTGLKNNAELSFGEDNNDSPLLSKGLPLNKLETIQCRAKRIKDIQEEKRKWEVLLHKFEEQQKCPGLAQQPNKIMKFDDIYEKVKNRAHQDHYITGHFPYDDIKTRYQQLFNKTIFEIENCISKTNQLKKIQERMKYLVEEQFENFMCNVHDTSILSTSDNDICHIIEKRIALVSPANK